VSVSSRRWRAATLAVLGAAVLALSTASPAAAHAGPKNYVTAVISVLPAVQGLEVSTTRNGSWLTIANGTRQTVTVLGYEHEAYLKITADGVWQNAHSPATALNEDLGGGETPAYAITSAPPDWRPVSNSSSYRYHDRRTHWTGKGRPAVVAQSPDQPHLIRNWTIDLLVGETPTTVTGTLSWTPSKLTALDWFFGVLCVALALAFGVVMLVEDRGKPKADGEPSARRSAADVWTDLHKPS
jgi:hypothetical protein